MPQSTGKASFDNSLILIKISLWLSGVNLFHEHKKKLALNKSILFYVNFFWLYTAVSGEFLCLYGFAREGRSFEEISLIAPFPLICALGTVKVASIFVNKSAAVIVLKKLRKLHPDVLTIDEKNIEKSHRVRNEVQKRIIHSTKQVLFKFVISMCLGIIFDITLFCVVPLISMIIDYSKFGRTDLKLPYYVRYFFDPYSMPWWPGEYIHQVGGSLIVCVNIFGADALLYAFCLYLRMHFKILSNDFERLTPTKERLRELVLRHQELIELVNEVQNIYSTSMLFNIIISSFTICFCGFNITFLKDLGTSFAFFNFLVMSLYQIFMLCLFGDMISVSSTKISDAIYKNKWYEAEPEFRRSFFIIIMRSQKPCALSAAKFATLNLTAFTKILSRSWSYFAVLRTMYR